MASSTRKVVLSFLAHPDDAEILCAGALIRLAHAGWEIHIATATAGDCGTTTHSPWEISAIRTREAREAAAQIGATYHCLGESDLQVVFDKATILKTVELFRRVAPTLVLTHAPKDYMMDHEVVSQLARAASFGHGAPNISTTPLIPGTCIPHLYYCDPIEGLDPFGREVTPTTLIDITGVMELKLKMLACHASQREWLRAHHGMDEYLEATRRFASHRGRQLGTGYAEGFVQHRGHAYPNDDLLSLQLGA